MIFLCLQSDIFVSDKQSVTETFDLMMYIMCAVLCALLSFTVDLISTSLSPPSVK